MYVMDMLRVLANAHASRLYTMFQHCIQPSFTLPTGSERHCSCPSLILQAPPARTVPALHKFLLHRDMAGIIVLIIAVGAACAVAGALVLIISVVVMLRRALHACLLRTVRIKG